MYMIYIYIYFLPYTNLARDGCGWLNRRGFLQLVSENDIKLSSCLLACKVSHTLFNNRTRHTRRMWLADRIHGVGWTLGVSIGAGTVVSQLWFTLYIMYAIYPSRFAFAQIILSMHWRVSPHPIRGRRNLEGHEIYYIFRIKPPAKRSRQLEPQSA